MNKLFQSLNNVKSLLAKFNQFKQQFTGDPRQKVQELLNSGQMSQEQYNELRQMAHDLFGVDV